MYKDYVKLAFSIDQKNEEMKQFLTFERRMNNLIEKASEY